MLLLSFGYYNSNSQNLIMNGSFENYTAPVNCSGGSGGFDNYSAFPVNHVLDNWYPLNSPDYFSQLCNGVSNNGSPVNLFGYSIPKQGNAYVGFIGYGSSYETKEYPYQQLSTPLQAGKIYCLSFYVSRADRVTHAIKNIGAYFSVSAPTLFSSYYVNSTPQIENQSGFITDTIGWTEIQGCFTAVGGEQYITIGNFNSNANTDTLYVGTNNALAGAIDYAYYYIDDVTLIDQSTVGLNELNNERSIEVHPNPSHTGEVSILTDADTDALEVEINAVNGLNVLKQNVTLHNHAAKVNLKASEGVYIVIITNTKTKQSVTKKLVIQ